MKGMKPLPITILYVEDDVDIRREVAQFLIRLCTQLVCAGDGIEALESVRKQRPHLLITDIRMPRLGGLELVEKLAHMSPETAVVITTAFSEVPLLLRAIELGVCGFIRKPLDYKEMAAVIRRACLPMVQRSELEQLVSRRTDQLSGYLGGAACLQGLLPDVVAACEEETPVVIEGERGCGKSMLANLLHRQSARFRRACIPVCCRALTPGQFETELLGSKRWGIGRLTAAAGGTIIFTGLEEMPLPLQAILLKIMEAGCYYPLGETTPLPVTCRIIATVRSRLRLLTEQGSVDASLANYLGQRLIRLPPLREYGEDFDPYCLRFLAESSAERYQNPPFLEPDALHLLKRHFWPENFRELKRVMQHACRTASGRITSRMIMERLESSSLSSGQIIDAPATIRLDELERWAILTALERSGGRRMQAAELLNIDYKRFKRKLRFHDITSP